MRLATFNVLADAYTSYGDYSHVDPNLMQPGARLDHLTQQINDLDADVIGLQEADRDVVEVFEDDKNWQSFWTPKKRNKPDGCLTLVKHGVEVADHESFAYNDETGHVFQVTRIGQLAIANTHLKWAPADEPHHIGVAQTKELLHTLDNHQSAAILADCNDRPGGPVRAAVEKSGYLNLVSEHPTAIVNGELVSIDLLAIRGVTGQLLPMNYDVSSIPNEHCASDHIPVTAELTPNN